MYFSCFIVLRLLPTGAQESCVKMKSNCCYVFLTVPQIKLRGCQQNYALPIRWEYPNIYISEQRCALPLQSRTQQISLSDIDQQPGVREHSYKQLLHAEKINRGNRGAYKRVQINCHKAAVFVFIPDNLRRAVICEIEHSKSEFVRVAPASLEDLCMSKKRKYNSQIVF